MTETPRSNRPTPRTAAAVEAELKRRIRAELTQARADADGELNDASLASVIAGAIAAALGWHLESPEHARNATVSSRTWRPAVGPRGGDRSREVEEPRPFEERNERPFGDRPPRPPFPERPPFRDRDRGPRQYDDRAAPPRREPRDADDRDFPGRGPQARPPFNPRGGNRPSGGGGFGPRRNGGGGRPPSGRGGGGGGFGPRRAPPRSR